MKSDRIKNWPKNERPRERLLAEGAEKQTDASLLAVADEELRRLPVFYRRQVAQAVNDLLGTEPTRESASRIKKLRQPAASVYRLRVGDYRVFYDVIGDEVTVLHVRQKRDSAGLYGG